MLGKRLLTKAIKRAGRVLGLDIQRRGSSIGNMDSFLALLRSVGFHPTTILDVGAHDAEWSRLARTFFPQARFVLVEPQVEMQPQLETFCNESPGSRWKLAGAGREAGEMTLAVWPDLAGSSLLPSATTSGNLEHRRVPIVTIDSLFASGQELPQLAKLDIQGFELEALAGATNLFGHTECFIVETNLFRTLPEIPSFFEVVSYFHERGYKVYDVPGRLRRPLDNALSQVDLAFARKGGTLDSTQAW